MQEATVKASTSLRTKKRGNVPPRLETLFMLVVLQRGRMEGNVRSE